MSFLLVWQHEKNPLDFAEHHWNNMHWNNNIYIIKAAVRESHLQFAEPSTGF